MTANFGNHFHFQCINLNRKSTETRPQRSTMDMDKMQKGQQIKNQFEHFKLPFYSQRMKAHAAHGICSFLFERTQIEQ